jgi:TolA-binding protein
MKRALAGLLVGLALACGPARVPEPVAPPESVAQQELAQANELARANNPKQARDLYLKVAREYPTDPAAAEALYALGLLRASAKGPLRDYGAARVAFERVLDEHPQSARAPEARVWAAVLRELQRRQAETRRLRGDLERVKTLDMELEKRR